MTSACANRNLKLKPIKMRGSPAIEERKPVVGRVHMHTLQATLGYQILFVGTEVTDVNAHPAAASGASLPKILSSCQSHASDVLLFPSSDISGSQNRELIMKSIAVRPTWPKESLPAPPTN